MASSMMRREDALESQLLQWLLERLPADLELLHEQAFARSPVAPDACGDFLPQGICDKRNQGLKAPPPMEGSQWTSLAYFCAVAWTKSNFKDCRAGRSELQWSP